MTRLDKAVAAMREAHTQVEAARAREVKARTEHGEAHAALSYALHCREVAQKELCAAAAGVESE